MTKCQKCESGPAGVEGHDKLFTHSMTSNQVQFRCQECGSIWTRHYAPQGTYTWAAPDGVEHPGVRVPGSATQAS